MAGLPVELFDRAYGAGDGFVATESPVMYDVWREFATRGPQARPRLLLGLAEASNPRVAAERLAAGRSGVDPPSVGVAGEWLVVRVDLVQLVCVVLPLTRWGRPLRVVSALSLAAVVDLLAPLDELLSRPDGDSDASVSAFGEPIESPAPDDASSSTVEVPFTQREEEIASWLLRVLARIWGFDADLDSERILAAGHLLAVLAPLRPSAEQPDDEEPVDSISLDRAAGPAEIGSPEVAVRLAPGSAVTVKADAARRLFQVDASAQTWAVLDTGGIL